MLANRLVLNLRTYRVPSDLLLATSDFPSRTIPGPNLDFVHDLIPAQKGQCQDESRILGNIGAPLDHEQWDHPFEWSAEGSTDEWVGSTAVSVILQLRYNPLQTAVLT